MNTGCSGTATWRGWMLAFFTMNGYVSIIIFVATLLEIFMSGGARMKRHIAVAITGASGAVYGIRLVEELLGAGTG